MVIRKKGYLCGKCFKIYKTQKEALKCEGDCLDKQKASSIYDIFLELYDQFKEEKGAIGYKFFAGQLKWRLEKSKQIMEAKQC